MTEDVISNPADTIATEDVVAYLRQRPDFLLQHPEVLTRLNLLTQSPGVTSLSQRQLHMLRDQVTELSGQIREMTQIASDNERLFQIYAELYTQLPGCQNLLSVEKLVRDSLLQLPHLSCVSLLLSRDTFEPGPFEQTFVLCPEQFSQLQRQRLRGGCYLGRLNLKEKSQIFGNCAGVGSVALLQLENRRQPIGLLAVGSPLPDHFNPKMDATLFRLLGRSIVSLLPNLMGK